MPYARNINAFLVATAAIFALTSCQEEVTYLFSEDGVWSLEKYSLAGDPYDDINQGRKNRFLLRFKSSDKVVAAAACHEEATDVNPDSSSCTNATLSTWSCQCFSYTYHDAVMVWQEFDPGTTPPPVGAVDGGGDTGGTGAYEAHEVDLSAFEGTAATYQFDSLPEGVFGSDGDISKHVFQLKAATIWTDVDVNMDGMKDLDMCSSQCFPSEAGG